MVLVTHVLLLAFQRLREDFSSMIYSLDQWTETKNENQKRKPKTKTKTKNQIIFSWCKWKFDNIFIHFEWERQENTFFRSGIKVFLSSLFKAETWPLYLSSISILTKYQYTDTYT